MTHLIHDDLVTRYRSPWSTGSELLALLMSLSVYWYTAKAFAPAFSSDGGFDYFSFVLVGELTFMLPSFLLEGFCQSVRRSIIDGTLEPMILLPRPLSGSLSLILFSRLPRELLRAALLLLLAGLFFHAPLSLAQLGGWFLLQLAAMPLFLGAGMLAGAFLLAFGRGERVISWIGVGGMLIAGAWFPATVLPKPVQALNTFISPYHVLLQGTRDFLESGWNASMSHHLIGLLGWGVILLPLGYAALEWSVRLSARRSRPWALTTF